MLTISSIATASGLFAVPLSICLSPKWMEPVWSGADDARPLLFKNATMPQCLSCIADGGLGFAVVLDDDTRRPLGIIDAASILRYTLNKGSCQLAVALDLAGPCDHLIARTEDSVDHVLDSISSEYVLLVNRAGTFQGIVTRTEMLFQANTRLREYVRKTEHLIEEMRLELSAARKHSSEIMSVLAHDLRGPIGGIQNLAQLFSDDTTTLPMEDIRHFGKLIAKESAALVQRTSEVLEMSRVSGSVELKMNVCQPVDIMQEASEFYGVIAQQKGITFTLDLPTVTIPTIVADRTRIIRVITSLLDNAVKYCRSGEAIRATIETTPHSVAFVISDNGQGLPKAEIPNLFKRFGRGSSQPTGGEPSSGLGLSIALDIMRSHGGNISVTGDSGKGLAFRVVLGVHNTFPAVA